jgi:hypothetical protein
MAEAPFDVLSVPMLGMHLAWEAKMRKSYDIAALHVLVYLGLFQCFDRTRKIAPWYTQQVLPWRNVVCSAVYYHIGVKQYSLSWPGIPHC